MGEKKKELSVKNKDIQPQPKITTVSYEKKMKSVKNSVFNFVFKLKSNMLRNLFILLRSAQNLSKVKKINLIFRVLVTRYFRNFQNDKKGIYNK